MIYDTAAFIIYAKMDKKNEIYDILSRQTDICIECSPRKKRNIFLDLLNMQINSKGLNCNHHCTHTHTHTHIDVIRLLL